MTVIGAELAGTGLAARMADGRTSGIFGPERADATTTPAPPRGVTGTLGPPIGRAAKSALGKVAISISDEFSSEGI